MDFGVDWSELPTDLLAQIARRLPMMEDLMAFRGVCTGWRSAAPKDRFLTVSKVPVLMLAEKIGRREREFYSLSKRKICMRKHLPEAKGKRCTDVGFGWVLTLSTKGAAFLFKPFSSAPRIELPGYKKFPEYSKNSTYPKVFFIKRGVLTANPSETSNFTLLVDANMSLGIWKNGDENWTKMFAQPQDMVLRPDGKMYKLVCSLEGRFDQIEIWDPQATDFSKPQALVQVRNVPDICNAWDHYLVESTDGELLLIKRNNAGPFDGYFETGADHFGVMRVDLVTGECTEIDHLGKDAIFVGHNASVAVDATEFPGVLKPNCIYFTDDRHRAYRSEHLCPNGGGKDMGIYNVADSSIERFGIESSLSRLCPPQWIFPSF